MRRAFALFVESSSNSEDEGFCQEEKEEKPMTPGSSLQLKVVDIRSLQQKKPSKAAPVNCSIGEPVVGSSSGWSFDLVWNDSPITSQNSNM